MSFSVEQTNSVLQTYHIKEEQTVKEFLLKLKLEDKFFAIIVNGKRAKLTDILLPKSEVILFPKIAGG